MNKFLTVFVFLFSTFCFAQFSPAIRNFNLGEYNAGNQNWDITRAENGKVYVANNSGLLEYDSKDWKFFQLPNKTTVRSVLTVDDLIYTGSFEEFGFWKKNEKGLLKYHSLSDSIKETISANEEIWEIVKFGDKIIFRSFLNIYVYDGSDVLRLRPGSTIISCHILNNILYVSTLNKGLFILENDTLQPFFFTEELINTKVISIINYEDKLLLLTSLKGSFFLKNNKLSPTNFKINDLIEENQLNDFSILENGDMVFGTIKDGVFVADKEGFLKFHISKENGLINNTILGQYVDETNKLWLGLDNGIAYIDIGSSNYFFNDVSGKLGAVYDIVKFNGILYVGSNTGLFYFNSENKLEFIEGTQGQVWDLRIIDDKLFCGHNDGTFLVEGNTIEKISDFTGGWTIKKIPERDDAYIQGTYTGLVKFERINDEWNVRHMGKTTIPSRFLVFENPSTAWVAHAYKGIYKVNFSRNYDSIIKISNYESKGIKSNYNVRVYNIKNDIVFKTNEGWQKYEPILDSIVPYPLLNKKLGVNSYIISEEGISPLALKTDNGVVKFKTLLNADAEKTLSGNFIKDRFIVDYEHVSRIEDSIYALNLDNGLMLIDENYNESNTVYKPQIESISISGNYVAIDDFNFNDDVLDVDHNQNFIVEISSPKSSNHYFEYNIPSLSNEWIKIDNRTLELSNVENGEYQIAFRTKDDSGNVSETIVLTVDILPPWYKGTTGMILYLFLLLGIAFLFYYLHNRKIYKEQRIIKIKYQREQQKLLREKTLENEKRIVQLKNESLQNEIKLKSKQLANTAMALVKKNEILQDIKRELKINKEGFNNFYAYKKLVKRVDYSIEHKDEWDVFEENFNQVHDEFFEVLKSRHPKLTSKDLKICAYIKMNLATKEIAPLMNISVRGVETHRYRLKKKLDLENDTSLVDYLLNIK